MNYLQPPILPSYGHLIEEAREVISKFQDVRWHVVSVNRNKGAKQMVTYALPIESEHMWQRENLPILIPKQYFVRHFYYQ